MRKLWIVFLILVLTGGVYAHNQAYQGKAFTFYAPDRSHKIDVMLDGHDNMLSVSFDNVEIGTRTNYCTPVN